MDGKLYCIFQFCKQKAEIYFWFTLSTTRIELAQLVRDGKRCAARLKQDRERERKIKFLQLPSCGQINLLQLPVLLDVDHNNFVLILFLVDSIRQ
jgi:hypothetical protein